MINDSEDYMESMQDILDDMISSAGISATLIDAPDCPEDFSDWYNDAGEEIYDFLLDNKTYKISSKLYTKWAEKLDEIVDSWDEDEDFEESRRPHGRCLNEKNLPGKRKVFTYEIYSFDEETEDFDFIRASNVFYDFDKACDSAREAVKDESESAIAFVMAGEYVKDGDDSIYADPQVVYSVSNTRSVNVDEYVVDETSLKGKFGNKKFSTNESRQRKGHTLKEFYFEDPEDARWELNQGEYECCYCGREVTGAEGYCVNDDGEICCIECYNEHCRKNESHRHHGRMIKESAGRAKKVCEDGECWYEVEVDPNSDENTVVDCKFCGDTYLFKGLDETLVYNRSKNIQDILPNLEPEYREIFISGICPKCWDKMFGDEEDE